MRKMSLCLLVLATSFAFGSAKTYAQCAVSDPYYCQCDKLWHGGFYATTGGGDFTPQGQAHCCGQIVPNEYTSASDGCYLVKSMTTIMRKTLARLAEHNPVFLVACNGDLVPYQESAAPVPTWSADRALSSYTAKLAMGRR